MYEQMLHLLNMLRLHVPEERAVHGRHSCRCSSATGRAQRNYCRWQIRAPGKELLPSQYADTVAAQFAVEQGKQVGAVN